MSPFLRELASRVLDPALQSRWLCYVGDNTPENLVVESVTPAFPQIASESRFYAGQTLDFPGVVAVSAISITFYENDRQDVSHWLNQWRLSVYNRETQVFGLPSQYMKDIRIELYPVTDDGPVAELLMRQCWPSDQQPPELNYSNPEGRIMAVANFAVADMRFSRLSMPTDRGPQPVLPPGGNFLK